MANRRKPVGSQISESPQVQQIKLGLDDFILLLVLILICVVIGFYPYFHDPSWLVGTDAYWRYKDPLDHTPCLARIRRVNDLTNGGQWKYSPMRST